ncbi:MAG: OPT/YSL family transporter [Phycisphaerae bacterium]|nr:OPT/YSL family transporter [Phycisphaerae bacterium]
MALPQLNEEQVRTWTPEEKDRWWLANVFRGDMPQLTLRAAITGFLLGGVLCATNLYIGAKTGWSLGVGVTSVILSFAIFRVMAGIGLSRDLTILENNAVQSIATAAGYMTGPLISALAAYMFILNKPMPWHQMLIWNVLASILGVLVAFPMKRRFINNEQQPFPEGRAAAVVLDSLYPDAPQGGVAPNSLNGVRPVPSTSRLAAAAGVFKAKALFAAAAIGGFVQILVAEGYQSLIQVNLLRIVKAGEELYKIPERLDAWYYELAAQKGWWVPSIGGYQLQQLAVVPTIDLSMFGAGGLMGIRIASSLLIGCLVNFLVIAPLVLNSGDLGPLPAPAVPTPEHPLVSYNSARSHLVNNWCLWWGIGLMVTASLAGLLAKPKLLISAFTGMFGKHTSEDVLKDIEFPLWISLVGVPIMVGVTVYMNFQFFGIDPWLGLLSIPLIILLTLIAANATALTSTTPTGALSKITQFTFGAIEPTSPATNLITAGMTTEVAGNASNLLMDIKPGYMLGAKPRQQAWGHCIGIVAGALASTPLFFVLFLSNWNPASDVTIEQHVTEVGGWAMPGALQWTAVARLIEGMGQSNSSAGAVQTVDGISKLWGVLPVSAAWAMLVAIFIAIFFEAARAISKGKFPLSAVAIGLGVVIPPTSTLSMFAGAAFFSYMEHRNRAKPEYSVGRMLWVDSREAICAGLVAGWAILGIGDGLIGAGVHEKAWAWITSWF